MKTVKVMLMVLSLFLGCIYVQAQDRNKGELAQQSDFSKASAAIRQKAIRAQQEVIAHLLQALAHTRSPQDYQIGRNSLARQFIPVIEQFPREKRTKVQNNALSVLNNPELRKKVLGPELAQLDFRKDIYTQMSRTALIRPGQQQKSVQPKSGTADNATGKLKVRLKKVIMVDETNPEGGSDEIYLGAIFMDAEEKSSKKDPFHIADFNEGKYEEKKYDPHYTLKTFDVNPNQNGQTFFTHFMLFEEDGVSTMYEIVDIALDWVAGLLAANTYGASLAVKLIIDVIVTSIAADDQFPVFTHEIELNANESDFTKNYWYWVQDHGGKYELYFTWEYIAPSAQASQSLTAGEQDPLPLGKVYKGDDGIVYYTQQYGDKFYWYGEHPNGQMANVFAGQRKGNAISGRWASVPKGKAKASGQLSVEVVQTIVGPILKNKGRKGADYSTTKWLEVNPPNDMPGKGPAQFESGMGHLDGLWTGDDGGIYYLRQIGNQLYWFAQEDIPSGHPAFAQVAEGTINGDKIAMNWADIPKGMDRKMEKGIVILQKTGNHSLKNIIGPEFPATYLTRHAGGVRPICMTIDADRLSLDEHARGHSIKLNGQTIYSFQKEEEARKAFNLLTQNEMTTACRIGKGANSTQYLLSNESAPSSELQPWESCSTFLPRNLEVRKDRNGFILTAGRELYLTFNSEAEANTMKQMILKYRFGKYCKIGDFEYWR